MSCNAKKDPNGTWRIQYRWTDWTGTKKKSQKRGFKTKKEAEEWYAHFMLQQSSDPTMTLADFWEIYKADMEKRLRKTTMKQKEYVMNDKVLPYFGKTPINEITAPMIRKWQGELIEKGFKPTYLKTIHNQLSAILNYAVNFYDLRSNPCRKAGSMGKSKADERPYWTLEEFQKFYTEPFAFVPGEGGETILQLCKRTKEFWDEVTAKPEYEDKTILVATHGCALRAILHNIYEDKADFWHGFVPVNCAVSVVEVKDGNAKLVGDDRIYYNAKEVVNHFNVKKMFEE